MYSDIFKMELKEIITNEALLKTFINNNFEDPIKQNEAIDDDLLIFDEYNLKLKNEQKQYYLCTLPVEKLLALKRDTGVALYAFLQIDLEKIKTLVKHLGFPENIESEEELNSGQYRFLTWTFKPLTIWINQNITNSISRPKSNSLITVTNMDLKDLIKKEAVH